jgi:hypothetical protein
MSVCKLSFVELLMFLFGVLFGGVCGENSFNVFMALFMVLWAPIFATLCKRAVLMLWHSFLYLGLIFFPPFFFFAWWSPLLFLVRKELLLGGGGNPNFTNPNTGDAAGCKPKDIQARGINEGTRQGKDGQEGRQAQASPTPESRRRATETEGCRGEPPGRFLQTRLRLQHAAKYTPPQKSGQDFAPAQVENAIMRRFY